MRNVEITRKAHKQIAGMNKADMAAIYAALEKLAAWPDVTGVKNLVGREGYRLRIGDYRAMFRVEGETIIVTEVKRRNEHTY